MKKIILVAMMGCAAFAYACSGGDSSTDGGSDSGSGADSSAHESGTQDSSTQDSSAQDSSVQDSGADAGVVNECTTFVDMTADGGVITGPSGGSPSQYSPNCVHVHTGQSVTWNSNFTSHPLAAFGGDTPNPIQATTTGTTVTFAFPSVGTYGFHCGIHTGSMFGAVEVTQ